MGHRQVAKTDLQNDPYVLQLDWYYKRLSSLSDFSLVSQHVGQGTVNPTHYVVVHDHTEWDIDKLQKLTYKMTHMYYNWTGIISVSAPCQIFPWSVNTSGKEL